MSACKQPAPPKKWSGVAFRIAVGAFVALLLTAILFAGFWFSVPNERLLVGAARRDDLAEFKRIAAKGVSLDAEEQGMQGYTPLIAAAFAEGTNVFFYLLSAGAKVDVRGREGQTALMAAVMCGDVNLVKTKALVAAGADVNARDKDGASVLQYAEWAGHGRAPGFTVTNTINLLKEHGAVE